MIVLVIHFLSHYLLFLLFFLLFLFLLFFLFFLLSLLCCFLSNGFLYLLLLLGFGLSLLLGLLNDLVGLDGLIQLNYRCPLCFIYCPDYLLIHLLSSEGVS